MNVLHEKVNDSSSEESRVQVPGDSRGLFDSHITRTIPLTPATLHSISIEYRINFMTHNILY